MSTTGRHAGGDSRTRISHHTGGAPSSARLPVFEVPLADRRWFWGRRDLLQTLEAAWASRGAAPTQTLAGPGGVGKSQLAAQFAYRRRAESDVVWWVSCTPAGGAELHALARSRFGGLGAHLGLEPVDDAEARVGQVRRWLETTERRWLVIFDDVPEWSFIEAMVPQGGPGLCLITSRDRDWDLADRVLDVGVFDVDTGASFLQARAGIDDPGGARELATALGGLTLALEQAGAFLVHSPVPLGFAAYLDALRQRGLGVFVEGGVVDYDHVVSTVWERSLATVAATNPKTAELLELFAVLAPAPVPTEVVIAAGQQEDAFDVAAVLEQLRRYSLVNVASGAVVVHPLVQRAMAERMDAEVASVTRRRAIGLLDAAFPAEPTDPRSGDAATALIPHMIALFGAARSDVVLMRLVARAAYHLWAQGDYRSARQLEEAVLAARREVLGERHSDTLTSADNLAGTLWSLGELGPARQLLDEVLAARREMLGNRHPDTLNSADNLAATLRAQGELGRARQLQEEVLAARREVLGGRHPDTLGSANKLAATLRAQGQLGPACQLHVEVLAARREMLGNRHPDTLSAASNLAATLRDQGELDRARQLQEEVLAGCRQVLGERHLDTLASANNLAATLWDQGELDRARQLQEEVLAGCGQVLGARHTDTLISANNLAVTLRAQGELGRARRLHEAVLAGCREVLGKRHPDTLSSAGNLAETLREQGELDRARQLHEEVLAARREMLGNRHPDTLSSANNLAETLRAQGQLGRARELQEEVLAGFRQLLGERHPNTRVSADNLAETLTALGESAAASRLKKEFSVE